MQQTEVPLCMARVYLRKVCEAMPLHLMNQYNIIFISNTEVC